MTVTRRSPLPDRLWAKVDKTDDCWLWTGHVMPAGYGTIGADGRDLYVHRVAYELLVGPISAGYTIDHLCRVKRCVNPAHLEAVTLRENILRSDGPSAINARKTHCVHGHALAGRNLYVVPRTGRRQCVTCRAARRAAA